MLKQDDVIERTSIVTYSLLQELYETLADPKKPDDVSLGIIMGLAMFLDEKIGPFRSQRLMQQAPEIILKTDAHVTEDMQQRFEPVLRAFGSHLSAYQAAEKPSEEVK